MTTQGAINRLAGGQKPGANSDQRRTICKICLCSILNGQPAVWLTKPMGLCHKACAGQPVSA